MSPKSLKMSQKIVKPISNDGQKKKAKEEYRPILRPLNLDFLSASADAPTQTDEKPNGEEPTMS